MDKFGRSTYEEHVEHIFEDMPHMKVSFEIENCPHSGALGVYLDEFLKELKRATSFKKELLDKIDFKNLKIKQIKKKRAAPDCIMCKYGEWPTMQ